ncbi:hypothetical protein [Granulicella arctica]|uniref:Uncharacterized protein n=1 Tax=Granulicella arctica TaxID=940613 RepID=A0A7Y9TU45_9BACT|nr:hypothetical protein [Granulicella arctica]NYF80578.1 hypothetical protein [Granulicella arctica]
MELHISMIPSPEDPPCRSDGYQSELRDLGLTLKADGLELREVGTRSVRPDCLPSLSGEWRIQLGATLGTILGAPVGSWLQARRGRTVRLTIGKMEADVQTADQLESVIKIAKFYQDVAENDANA